MFGSEQEESSSQHLNMHFDHQHPQQSFTSPSIHMRQLLISCAEHISRCDFYGAHRLINILSANSSHCGDSTERLVHQFNKALNLRLNRYAASGATSTSNLMPSLLIPKISAALPSSAGSSTTQQVFDDESVVQSAYLSLNQITPFIRFTHLTANQAILESVEGHHAIHILDFNIMHGVQWPPLMQAMAEKFPPPMLRITGTGDNLSILRRTGDRLAKFAHTLGLRFQFHPVLLLENEESISSFFNSFATYLEPNETLAVNCVLYLHRLSRERLSLFLHQIKALNPRVLTLAEREANHNFPIFLQRFVEALDHYTALFDSLEATLPPNSRQRIEVEQIWFGREISDIVAAEGDGRRERHERFRAWELMLRGSGFHNLALSPFALSQAKLLLRLHYPSEGYKLDILNDSFFLGWQNQHLFSVSSWH
ncbi:scarecrow-like protein 18 [Heracleum sosnowskyi]|uniref:Scarecrow-like protein 18 n=1 Tax=Heracleum sosnowskyi TaxID=360622 RepID=A0AAD8HJ09_9APIA|nr:scarecrow-like protein 18 [Heracleum sosnowskyi]KAK1367213.1 scarecrow-like protein 18 [Heracleum sosnowskyi]